MYKTEYIIKGIINKKLRTLDDFKNYIDETKQTVDYYKLKLYGLVSATPKDILPQTNNISNYIDDDSNNTTIDQLYKTFNEIYENLMESENDYQLAINLHDAFIYDEQFQNMIKKISKKEKKEDEIQFYRRELRKLNNITTYNDQYDDMEYKDIKYIYETTKKQKDIEQQEKSKQNNIKNILATTTQYSEQQLQEMSDNDINSILISILSNKTNY